MADSRSDVSKVWPQLIPCPHEATYSVDDMSGIVRTEMESGYTDQVNKLSERLQVVNLSWLMTEDIYLYVFQPFVWRELDGGAARFLFKIKENRIESERELIAKFKPEGRKIYNSQKTGNYWRVTAVFDYENVQTISNYEAQLMELNIIAKRLCRVAKNVIGGCA